MTKARLWLCVVLVLLVCGTALAGDRPGMDYGFWAIAYMRWLLYVMFGIGPMCDPV